jgi:aminoglycoside phosphotransferase (APT) family kinase protein
MLAGVLKAFDLGEGTLSSGPVARGWLGEIWRLDSTTGSWAVKTRGVDGSDPEDEVESTAAFHEAAVLAGLPAPAVRRTRDGRLLAEFVGTRVGVLAWVDMAGPDSALDPVAVGSLLAGLHGMPAARFPGPVASAEHWVVRPWFQEPVGAAAWDEVIGRVVERGAPFALDLAAHRNELVALEGLLAPPGDLLWCHRDLFCDNVRATPDGGIVVFDFDNSGPCDPSWELAFVLTEYATEAAPTHAFVDAARARALYDAYRSAGGPGRLTGPGDFTMVAAVLGHIAELAATRWLDATDDAERSATEAWAAELTDRPLTRQVIDHLLTTCAD